MIETKLKQDNANAPTSSDACCSSVAPILSAATFQKGRTYKIHGMDCAEEVAVLKRAVGPLVGGADRLAFDVLNGRMTVTKDAHDMPEEMIAKAVAATGMSAVPWEDQAGQGDANDHRRG